MKVLIVGSGFGGSVFSNLLANSDTNCEILVIDKRSHLGGNCFTYTDKPTGIEVHKYGPHIFHTNDDDVWNYINKFTEFNDYKHKVKINTFNNIYSFPINLHTINQLYTSTFTPKEAEEFVKNIAKEYCKKFDIIEPKNFEEQVISLVGYNMYNVFYRFYTKKQWERDPKDLPASIAKRIPVRFNYDDTYFNNAKYQGIPKNGYTEIFKNMLNHKNIRIELETNFSIYKSQKFDYIIYTGPIDEYFDYRFGKLDYRTVSWINEYADGDYQGTSIINYADMDYPWTRIIEHKYFTPEKKFNMTIISKEYSKEDDGSAPCYPIRDEKNIEIYNKYEELAKKEKNVIFIGRLAQYRYYDMDQVIAMSMKKYKEFIK